MKWGSGRLVEEAAGSHPARGAWVEIEFDVGLYGEQIVAPRKGCVG